MVELIDIKAALEAATDVADSPIHIAAFAAWILRDDERLGHLVNQASDLQGQSFLPEHAAVLGYGLAAGLLSADQQARLEAEIAHISGRIFFAPNRARRFEVDGIALLGVTLAAAPFAADSLDWLTVLLGRSLSEGREDPWHSGLVNACLVTLGDHQARITPVDLAAALALRGVGELYDDDLRDATDLVILLERHPSGAERAAVRLAVFNAALERQTRISFGAISREDLVRTLRSTQKSMRLWRYEDAPRTASSLLARWEIENEYHVQALLWVILAPLFADLEDEENLPSIGHKNPRADLAIPSLRTIVEVKFVRSAGQSAWAGILEEVAADSALYLSNTSVYDNIIAVIWDDAAHTEQHEEMRSGLEKLKGVSAAIIIPRPGKMRREGSPVAAGSKPRRRSKSE
ncbi:hypothetical protein U8P71_04850 [Rhizobium ruizarguesonis]|uniref:PD-(D/E)XK nuclease domain-containing protein n=1 Tax=Rhizobium ruizarguesonis TaxID=2081791 RepID=UPI00102F6C89|nr:hypothetical protein [Rhizobium ruizarguesonis]TBE31669.1 hypothetical protein ELH07_02645 [Rhizobium ruizarguesonis]WSH02360.1 hypothetical protein U8P71_04850 [Rhizobium ruizarguesonis]